MNSRINRQQITMANSHKKLHATRSCRGQGLAEGVCGTSLIVGTFVLLTMLGLNVYTAIVAHEKLRVVATEAARVIDSKQYWLGMSRPDANTTQTRASATALANALAAKLGLPKPSDVTYLTEHDKADPSITYTSCTVTCPALPLPYAISNLFPSVLNISETGVSGDMATPPYAVAFCQIPLGGKVGGYGAITIPMYSTAFPNTVPGISSSYRAELKGGIPSGDLYGPFDSVKVTFGDGYTSSGKVPAVLDTTVTEYGAGKSPEVSGTREIGPG